MIIPLEILLPIPSSDLTQGKHSSKTPQNWAPLYLVLLRVGFTAPVVTNGRRELLPHAFTLTHVNMCGLLSVALSLGLPPLDVIQHPALRSSDFPPVTNVTSDHLFHSASSARGFRTIRGDYGHMVGSSPVFFNLKKGLAEVQLIPRLPLLAPVP